MTSIPITRMHIENDYNKFSKAYADLCAEENRTAKNIKACKAAIFTLHTSLHLLDMLLERALKEEL